LGYKSYKDKRGNDIDFIDGKWQMYDDGGYYEILDRTVPNELLTPTAKAKAGHEYKKYVADCNVETEKSRKRIIELEKSWIKGGEKKMAKYKNSAIKGWDEDGKPIGDFDLIMLMDQQQTLKENVYPSKKELKNIDRAVKKGVDKTLGENLYESSKKGGDKKMSETQTNSMPVEEKKKYSQSEKFRYRAEKCKKGSTRTTKDGEKPISDFKRGEMCGRNKEAARNLAIQKKKGLA